MTLMAMTEQEGVRARVKYAMKLARLVGEVQLKTRQGDATLSYNAFNHQYQVSIGGAPVMLGSAGDVANKLEAIYIIA
jgi:hypothetical protein